MIRTDRAVETDIEQRFHNFIHIEAAVAGQMRAFLKIIRRIKLQVADMREMNPAF